MYKIFPIVHVMSKLIMLFSCMYIFPSFVSIYYQDGTLDDFLVSIFLGLAFGLFLWASTRKFERELKPRDGFILVTLVWVGFAATATTPFLLYFPGISFADAFFESMSGISTTGATVLVGLDSLPPAINFWRHFLNWLGGMGIIVLAVAVLPMLGVGGMQLYKAEMPGLIKDSKLTPRIATTAKNLWIIYALFTVLCAFSLKIAGMNWFDSICHAFATLSLGGFSTHDASIGYYDSIKIEVVLELFMLLAATNFTLHFIVFRSKSFSAYLKDYEFKTMMVIIVVSVLLLSFYLYLNKIYDFWTALRHVSFNLISIATDCGFSSLDFGAWPSLVPMWILILSSVTCCAGSTGGGVKMARNLVLLGQFKSEMVKLLHPHAVSPIKLNGKVLPASIVQAVLAFIFAYIGSVIILSFILMASGMDFVSAYSAILACINNAGPGLGEVGPASNYSVLNEFQIWICCLAMLLGRLELFTLFILFTPDFWRK